MKSIQCLWNVLSLCLLLQSLNAAVPDQNVLIYNEGDIQIQADVSEYEKITSGKEIQGTITVTHGSREVVDRNSFAMGNYRIKTQFAKTVALTPTFLISIFHFKLPGMPVGDYTLPPITVKVGGKMYAAPPLIIQVYD